MEYNLNNLTKEEKKESVFKSLKQFLRLISNERNNLKKSAALIFLNSMLLLFVPFLISYTVDHFLFTKEYRGLINCALLILFISILNFITGYFQSILMGGIGQRMLFSLRNKLFNQLQQLPAVFFNLNKSGDLISRVNYDTDKLNQFFSQSLVQFISNLTLMLGAAFFILFINLKLGVASLLPALFIFLFTKSISPWVKRKSSDNIKAVGKLSAEVKETLSNFKVTVAFNRRDYFQKRFNKINQINYQTALKAGLSTSVFIPLYGLLTSIAQLIVLIYGIALIKTGQFKLGLLIGYLFYIIHFYTPLKQLAALWTNLQVAMASWDRINQILTIQPKFSDAEKISEGSPTTVLLEFRNVFFSYDDRNKVLRDVSFTIAKGRSYAFVGPTGEGKTTIASLISRLYTADKGEIFFNGRNINNYPAKEYCSKIGFILQEPFLFSGTIKENILYGNEAYQNYSNEQLQILLREEKLDNLLSTFESGLDTFVSSELNNVSLGQKQLISLIRAILRNPELLILDEATANIDTVTEKQITSILLNRSSKTTLLTIAHRLNTIENAEEIFFVNAGNIINAGSTKEAITLLVNSTQHNN